MKIGFIGFGNMAKAIIRGLNTFQGKIYVTAKNKEKLLESSKDYKVEVMASNSQLAKEADLIVLSVKPYQYEEVAKDIDALIEGKIIISLAPSMDYKDVEKLFSKKIRAVAAMPNTPITVGEGMTLVNVSPGLNKETYDFILKDLFKGKTMEVGEKIIKEAGSLNGCVPAFAYIFIEALSDAGVEMGLKREEAIEIAAQTLLGSAKMVLESGLHPGQLKDRVTSPGGTTIEGVRTLERLAFRSATIEAVLAARNKSLR